MNQRKKNTQSGTRSSIQGFAKRLKEKTTHFALHPKFSIIVPLYHTPLVFLDDMIQSVQKQTYENWELCLANGSPEDEELDAQVRKYMSKEPRIKYRNWKKIWELQEIRMRHWRLRQVAIQHFLIMMIFCHRMLYLNL